MTQIDPEVEAIEKEDRLHPIHVETDYLGRFKSVSRIRDLPGVYIDEPKSLGGENSGPTALETALAALNACSAMIIYIMARELKFAYQDLHFSATGVVDARRVEMKRSRLKYSEVKPVAEHYQSVEQTVTLVTAEPPERVDELRSEVHRLCPMHALLRDAGVPVEAKWVVVAPDD